MSNFKFDAGGKAYCGDRNTGKYYIIQIWQDLWGHWIVVVRLWGCTRSLGVKRLSF